MQAWGCQADLPDPPCSSPNKCSLTHSEGGVAVARYMTTCRPCPARYPWLGNARGQDTEARDVYEKYSD